MPLTVDQAAKITPLLLGAVALAGVVAVGVHIVPVDPVVVPDPDVEPVQAAAEPDSPAPQPLDNRWSALIPVLENINPPAVAEEGDGEADTSVAQDEGAGDQQNGDGETDPGAPTEMVGGDLRYLGLIDAGDRRFALVANRDRQMFVTPGQTFMSFKVEQVEPGYVVLTSDGRRQRLDRAQRDPDASPDDAYTRARDAAAERQREELQRGVRRVDPRPDRPNPEGDR